MSRAVALVVLFALAPATRAADDPVKVFEERILPIFKSPDPSSCVRCHLAAVDLKNYILPSAKDTFLALREQGLIDLDKPENSKILALINRGANDPKAAGLIKLARNPFFGSKRNNASILKLAPRLLRPQEAARDLRCRGVGVGVGVRESGRRPRSTKFARHSLRPGS